MEVEVFFTMMHESVLRRVLVLGVVLVVVLGVLPFVFAEEKSCFDSDNGRDAFVAGMLTRGGLQKSDECVISGKYVKEYSCRDGRPVVELLYCYGGCSQGACLSKKAVSASPKCKDSDGEDAGVAGLLTLLASGVQKQDACVIGDRYVKEYGCLGGVKPFVELLKCDAGCERGACVGSGERVEERVVSREMALAQATPVFKAMGDVLPDMILDGGVFESGSLFPNDVRVWDLSDEELLDELKTKEAASFLESDYFKLVSSKGWAPHQLTAKKFASLRTNEEFGSVMGLVDSGSDDASEYRYVSPYGMVFYMEAVRRGVYPGQVRE